jgi:hypothetical protein
MTKLAKVTSARALDGHLLAVTFSDGSRGTEDLADYIAGATRWWSR